MEYGPREDAYMRTQVINNAGGNDWIEKYANQGVEWVVEADVTRMPYFRTMKPWRVFWRRLACRLLGPKWAELPFVPRWGWSVIGCARCGGHQEATKPDEAVCRPQ